MGWYGEVAHKVSTMTGAMSTQTAGDMGPDRHGYGQIQNHVDRAPSWSYAMLKYELESETTRLCPLYLAL